MLTVFFFFLLMIVCDFYSFICLYLCFLNISSDFFPLLYSHLIPCTTSVDLYNSPFVSPPPILPSLLVLLLLVLFLLLLLPCSPLLLSSDFVAFKEAAEQFQPYIRFFATFEKKVSNSGW